MKPRVISSIVRRELSAYFSSPTGYVFITIFVFLSAFAAFWLPGFFQRNLANLDQLNAWYPALLLFLIPAITMHVWAEERKQGTEELLLTLPAHDRDLVLGKYFACLAIYTIAMLFGASNLIVLAWLGKPDAGVMASTYVGQWLAGAALIAVGMAASALTSNLTVAFILGALFSGVVVGFGALANVAPGTALADLAESLALPRRLQDFGRGVVTVGNLLYFAGVAGIGLWLNMFLISRRHWAGSPGSPARSSLGAVRGAALVVAAGALVALAGRAPLRADVTAEGLWTLSEHTRRLVREIPADKPVFITAHVSPEVPGAYAETRETLLGLLRELDSIGGERIALQVIETEPFTDGAREAQRNFNIVPRPVAPDPTDPNTAVREVFLGVAFTSGPEQSIIPFMSRGLPVEYEIARALRTVSMTGRKRVGVLDTDASLFGQFNMQTFTPGRDWPIVDELRKQHDVVRVEREGEIPTDLDLLIVAQPSTLTNEQLAPVVEAIRNGLPAVVLEDPLPLVNPGLATSAGREEMISNPFQRQQTPQAPKADLTPLYNLLGIASNPRRVIWDRYNPRPALAGVPPEFVFIGRSSGAAAPFNDENPITSGLQEVVLICPGEVTESPVAAANGAELTFAPLVRTGPVSGHIAYSDVLIRGFFGPQGFNPARRWVQTQGGHTLGAHVRGKPAPESQSAGEGGEAAAPAAEINVVFFADLDFVSEVFFNLREEGAQDFEFDNVTMILNAVDVLTGDESLVELRKRRRAQRTLERLEERRLQEQREAISAIDAANREADDELAKARARMNERVEEIRSRTDLDETTKQIQIQGVQQAEQRLLDVRTSGINDKKERMVQEASAQARGDVERIQLGIRVAAVALPPIPAFLLGCVVFVRRRAQEREGVSSGRLVD